MSVNPQAKAYADHFSPLFVSRYIEYVRAGRSDAVPGPIRASVEAYVHGRQGGGTDVNRWVWETLYGHRLRTGGDLPVPPALAGAQQSAAAGGQGGNGVAVAGAVAGGLFKIIAALIRMAPKSL